VGCVWYCGWSCGAALLGAGPDEEDPIGLSYGNPPGLVVLPTSFPILACASLAFFVASSYNFLCSSILLFSSSLDIPVGPNDIAAPALTGPPAPLSFAATCNAVVRSCSSIFACMRFFSSVADMNLPGLYAAVGTPSSGLRTVKREPPPAPVLPLERGRVLTPVV
jgi:hypothetical protein